jgi:hypothetical protein
MVTSKSGYVAFFWAWEFLSFMLPCDVAVFGSIDAGTALGISSIGFDLFILPFLVILYDEIYL